MSLPPQFKPIAHYIKIANEHRQRDPGVYYWCIMYATQMAMGIDKKSPECVQFLSTLLNQLEQIKKQFKDMEQITNEVVAQAHIEQAALKLFVWADSEDRASHFDKNIVKAFYTAGHIFDVLTLFGEMDEKIAENRKYAKWKAAYIHNCLKNGETPIPGPQQDGDYDETAGDPTGNIGFDIPAAGSGNESNQDSKSRNRQPSPPSGDFRSNSPSSKKSSGAYGGASGSYGGGSSSAADGSMPAASGGGGGSASQANIVQSQKYCKWAISALEYEDVPTAVENLEKALKLLKAGK